MDAARLQWGADHAVKTGIARIARIVQHDLVDRRVDEQLPVHALLIRGGQLRHGDEQRARAVRPGQSLERGAHHGLRAGSVEVDDIHIQRRERGHRLFHRVRDVVQLEVEKDPMAARVDLAHDVRPFGIKQLHADLHKRLLVLKEVEKCERLFPAVKIQRNDNVLTHDVLLL